jgi:hypothetical protein
MFEKFKTVGALNRAGAAILDHKLTSPKYDRKNIKIFRTGRGVKWESRFRQFWQ